MQHALTLFFAGLTAQAVPAVSVGPDTVSQAPPLEAPIEHVIVYSDRAQIIRRGQASLKPGLHTLRVAELHGGVFLDTIQASAEGAEVLRVIATPVVKERYSIAQADSLLDELEKLNAHSHQISVKMGVEQHLQSFVDSLRARKDVVEEQRNGRKATPLSATTWAQNIQYLLQRRTKYLGSIRDHQQELKKVEKQRQEVIFKLRELNLGAFSQERVHVAVVLKVPRAKTVKVKVNYFTPGAYWRPTYDLQYWSNQSKVSLQMGATVAQSTGEDWENVTLELSSGLPGRGIELPELLTWTLGEKKEFKPRYRAARSPRVPPLFPPPSPQATRAEILREEQRNLLVARFNDRANAGIGIGRGVGDMPSDGRVFGGYAGGKSLPPPAPRPSRQRSMAKRRSKVAKKMAESYAPAPEPAMDDLAMAEVDAEEITVTSQSISGSLTRSSGSSVRRTPMNLFSNLPSRRITISDGSLPARLAGGIDYRYMAPTKVTMKASGQTRKVPIYNQTIPVQVFHEATPSLSLVSYLKAQVRNTSEQPWLAGPMNLYFGNTFISQGRLATTGPKGMLSLPLGADENVRMVRKVLPTTRTDGTFSKDEVTEYKVVIEVTNHRDQPIQISLWDQVPLSQHEDVKIELLTANPPHQKRKKHDRGILNWKLDLIPSGKREVSFTYRITRPEGFQLQQR